MKIGVLEAGAPPGPLATRFGSYSNMFRRLLGPAFVFEIFDVRAGALPTEDDACTAYLITGSSSAVYDADPWIGDLETFITGTAGSAPMVGVCFGHQLMAQALGGKVIKSPKGWGVGLHQYDIAHKPAWMDSGAPMALVASHQDQVVELGPDARALGGNAFTPLAVVDYPSLKAMSIQAHPEFELEFARALIEARRGTQFDEETADTALASLTGQTDRHRAAVWLRRFLSRT